MTKLGAEICPDGLVCCWEAGCVHELAWTEVIPCSEWLESKVCAVEQSCAAPADFLWGAYGWSQLA